MGVLVRPWGYGVAVGISVQRVHEYRSAIWRTEWGLRRGWEG